MSRLETLSAYNAIDFSLSSSGDFSTYNESTLPPWKTNPLVHDILANQAPLRITANNDSQHAAPDVIFPSLPPILHGHPDIHLRNGIMKASCKAAAHEPDAEKAFFVADLSQVYRQHQRWITCLPEIQPFYGEQSGSAGF